MKLYTVCRDVGEPFLAVEFKQQPGELYSLDLLGAHYDDMNALIDSSPNNPLDSLCPMLDARLNIEKLNICAPILMPKQDVICLGINYRDHEKEANQFDSEAFGGDKPCAIYFSKRISKVTGHGDIIPCYDGLVDGLDYECELAVIIGHDAFEVKENEAQNYIFGYTILNDVSARNLQTQHKQWYFGKSLDGHTPFGPCILTADEISFPPQLDNRCSVNGELRQNSNTKYLIHGIPEIIAELSSGMTLKAGTIIATGTPAGVGMGFQPPRFLHYGDKIECQIESIGTLTNYVEDKKPQK